MKIPAICNNAHYLFEDNVMKFDEPVEIHVTRFGENVKRVEAKEVSTYPEYDINFANPDAYKVYMNCNEPSTSPHRESIEVVIANSHQYDLILTTDEDILTHCSNAVLVPYGTTWLNKGKIDDVNAIGEYSSTLDKLHKDKKFEVSFLCSFHPRQLEGYEMRKNAWLNQEHMTTPTLFYSSPRMILHNAPDWYQERILPFSGNPLPNDDKDELFHSQFHLSIESTKIKNYFTEKLIDALITKTVPVYWGCQNIEEFFNPEGIVIVENINDLVDKINLLTPETYESMLPHIEENFEIAKGYASSFAGRIKKEVNYYMSKNKSKPSKQNVEELELESSKSEDRILTIGIPSLHERKDSLNALLGHINTITDKKYSNDVEIIVNVDDGAKTVGQKRNEILEQATGTFICYVDDDDMIDEEYVNLIISTIKENPDLDCIGFTGMYYVNGTPTMLFKHANEYGGHYKEEGVQYRPVNHLNPVRTILAREIKFPEKNFGEDSDYCDRLNESGMLKNEVIIDKVMYHYLWNSELTRTH